MPTPKSSTRVAAIDVGSNGIRFLVVESRDAPAYKVLEQTRVPVRLGHDVFLTGKLADDAIDAACNAFATFTDRMRALRVSRYRAVATSAVRESSNGHVLLARATADAKLLLEPISGSEEARLVHVAVNHRVTLGNEKWLLADLGGGSVEVSIADQHGIDRTETHRMGSVRLLEENSAEGEGIAGFDHRLNEYAIALRNTGLLDSPVAGYIATGGNIEALARLASAPTNARGVSSLRLDDLRAVIARLARMSFDDRVAVLGLRRDRADVILPGAMVYERIGALAAVDTVLVPNVGLKEGIVLDLLAHPS